MYYRVDFVENLGKVENVEKEVYEDDDYSFTLKDFCTFDPAFVDVAKAIGVKDCACLCSYPDYCIRIPIKAVKTFPKSVQDYMQAVIDFQTLGMGGSDISDCFGGDCVIRQGESKDIVESFLASENGGFKFHHNMSDFVVSEKAILGGRYTTTDTYSGEELKMLLGMQRLIPSVLNDTLELVRKMGAPNIEVESIEFFYHPLIGVQNKGSLCKKPMIGITNATEYSVPWIEASIYDTENSFLQKGKFTLYYIFGV